MKKFYFLILMFLSLINFSCLLDEEEGAKVSKASFELSEISLGVGETKQVIFKIEPSELVTKTKVDYSVADGSQIIDITNESSNGCVITGKKNGNCVLVAKCEGFTSYLQVNVTGAIDIEPYIVTPYVVNVINPGERISINVSLYNGNTSDNALFEFSNSNDEIINIESANNAVVVSAVNKGYSKITVSHPKALYDATILIYVVPHTENACYITTSQNVVLTGLNEGTSNIKFSLVGSINNDLSLFSYSVKEGSENIDIFTNNNICSVKPKKTGYAVIEVSHPDSDINLEVQIIVVNTTVETYIESDSNLVVIDDGKFRTVNCSVIGSNSADDNYKFSYTLKDEGIINVNQVNNTFFIEPVRDGQTKIIVSNEYCNYTSEILVLVQNFNELLEDCFITTSQNVIKAEVGDEVDLQCLLIGGNEADKNGFTWMVDDSSIVNFITSYGNVVNSRAAVNYEQILPVGGLIVCKKPGLAEIKVTHPKSSVECVVKVKVYEKNTLNNSVKVKGDSIVKILKGSTSNYSITQISGNETNAFEWESKNDEICSVYGNGLSCVIEGKESGITEIVCTNKSMSDPFLVTVICGTQEELDTVKAIYCDDRNISLFKGDVNYTEIKCTSEINYDKYDVSINDRTLCEARFSQNVLIVKGLKAGKTEIVVSNEDASNSLIIIVEIFDNETIDKPYYIEAPKFKGIVIGNTDDIEVSLIGASNELFNGFVWEIEDDSVCSINGNGNIARVKGLKVGETKVTVSHPLSSNKENIVVYVCENEDELNSKNVISVSKNNYLAEIGDSIYIEAFINGSDIENINWNVNDISIIDVDSNNDSAFIRCLSEGLGIVTVSYKNAVSQKIFISIKKEGSSLEKDIFIPSILEVVKDTNKTIEAECVNLTKEEISSIEWSCDDHDMCNIKGNGEKCYVSILKSGTCSITLRIKSLGIERKCVVVGADSYEELLSSSYITMSKTYYRIKNGEQIDLNVSFGSVKPDDEVISRIIWKTNDSSIVDINYSGNTASIVALNEGIATVEVYGEGIKNKITFTVCVGDSDNADSYYITCEKIIGIVNGERYELELKLVDSFGNVINNSDNDYSFEIEDEEIVNCERFENVIFIDAKKSGKTYLNIGHPLSNKNIKVLVYTADTLEELSNMNPLSTDKDHYLIGIGGSAVLSLNTVSDDYVSDIKWNCSNTSVCRYEIGSSKKYLKVTGRKEGVCTFTASIGETNSVVFTVSVNEYGVIDKDIYMLSDSIIGLVKGETVCTSIRTNLSSDESKKIIWSSSDSSIIEVEGTGPDCNIKGLKKGYCELTAKYNSTFYSTLIVYVCDSQSELNGEYFFNIDKRYHYLNCGNTLSLRPFFGNNIPDDVSLNVQDLYQNSVVRYEYTDGILKVEGLNEGIAALRISSSKMKNTFVLYFEVNNSFEGNITESITGYLTGIKTVYVLDALDTINPVEIECVPVGIETKDYSTIVWKADDPSIISVVPDNKRVYVYANREGETVLRASSVYSSNVLSYRIIVTKNIGVLEPYIYTDVSTVEISAGEYKDILFEVKNISDFDIKKFSCESSDTSIFSCESVGNNVRVRGLTNGQALLSIKYDREGVQEKNIVISVKGVIDNLIYLTSMDNYSIIPEGSSKTLGVELIGYEELNGSNFDWEIVEENPDNIGQSVISISGNGKTRLCSALNPGIAKIKVTHISGDNSALFPVYLSVKVTDYLSENPLYISTENNIVTVTEGGKSTVTVNLVNGNESLNNQFVWTTSNTETIKLNQAGNQCLIQGLKAGVARVSVSHPRCPGLSIDIVIIVEEDISSETLYISTDSSIIEMKPTDSFKQINVTLNGGTAEQNTLFNWSILSFESAIKNKDGTSNAVISINASQDSAIVKPLREGTAIIRVTNSATRHYLDIKVLVTLYNSLKFNQSNITLTQFETMSVDVETPTGKTVIYESSNEEIATVTGTNRKCIVEGTGNGTCVIRAHTSDGSSSDELIVNVKKNTSVISSYISTSLNVLNLNVTDDVKGQVVKASLNGTDVNAADQDGIKWRISTGDTSVVKFLGVNGDSTNGNEVRIVPVGSGECSIILSHVKAKNDKVIYISVEQNNVTLKVSNDYLNLGVGEKGSLTATLVNSTDVEMENIVWKSLDTEIVRLHGSDDNQNVKGDTVIIMAEKVGEAIVQCTYGNITKNISIFVNEDPFVGFNEGSRLIGVNQTIEVKLNVSPKQYYNQVEISTNSSIYATVSKRLDDENMDCYVIISGTQLEGKCTITAKLLDVISTMDVTVTDDVSMKMTKSILYQKDGSFVETINPGSLWMNNDCEKIRCYYQTSPKGLKFDNKEGTYYLKDLVDGNNKDYPKFPSGSSSGDNEVFILTFGTDSENESSPYYFDLVPKSCFYGVLQLHNYDQNVVVNVPVCSSYDEFYPEISKPLTGNSSIDIKNNIINVAIGETVTILVDKNSVKDGMCTEIKTNFSSSGGRNIKVIHNESGNTLSVDGVPSSSNTKLQNTSYQGILTVDIYYPRFCDVYGTYRKTFIVNYEEWY